MKKFLQKRGSISKTTLLLTVMMFLGFASVLAQVDTAGQVHPSKSNTIHQAPPAAPPTQANPQTPAQAYPTTPESMPMDTLKKNHGMVHTRPADPNAPTKLTEAQIKILVGKDIPVGRDAHGHQLYKDSTRMIYYVGDGGTKVYVK